MSLPSHVDVLVIGAGPAGYMMANALLHLGINNVLVVDQREAGVEAGQADGIQPRTIEIMQSYGLATRLLQEANFMCMASMYNPDPKTGQITCTERLSDVHAPTARWPHELTLHQGGIEAIFRDAMLEKGLKIQFGKTVEDMQVDKTLLTEKDGHPITAKIISSKTKEAVGQVKAKYVVGCDGAHSWTRKWLGYEMQGEQTEYVWGVMDGVPETNFPDWRCKCAIHSLDGSCMVLPREDNKLRLYIQLAAQSGESEKTSGQAQQPQINGAAEAKTLTRIDRGQYGLEDIKSKVVKILAPYHMEFPKVEWWTVYVIGQRVASAFAKHSRVFICGDACHTHSPKAGQGANASMGDANNLAWKLAMSLKGLAKDSSELLGTYEMERRQFAQDLIAFDRVFSSLFSGKAYSKDVPDGISHGDFVAAFRKFGAFSSGIGINYIEETSLKRPRNISFIPPSAASQALAGAAIVGSRIPTTVVIRAADGRRFQLHDLLPMRLSFRVLLWVGDITKSEPKKRAQEQLGPVVEKLLRRFTPNGQRWDSVIDVISIMASPTVSQVGWQLPESMRMFGDNRGWEKVFTDDVAYHGQGVEFQGGKAYESFGIDPHKGAALIVRPDNHVAAVLALDDPALLEKHLIEYFDQILVGSCSR